MITPRRTRLVRVPDLQTFRAVIAALHTARKAETLEESPLVVTPTSSAARQLHDAFPDQYLGPVTRDDLYERFHRRLTQPPRRLTRLEREVLAQAATRTARSTSQVSFRLRPGLVSELLRFYDHLRRQSQQVSRFEELIADRLGSFDEGQGVERLRDQTRFLADSFREYERRAEESGAVDEHMLRERLMSEAAADPIRAVIVTVGDWIADPAGLYSADFDLLARIPGLAFIDIVSTEALLRSGFHERLHDWLPGIEEVSAADIGVAARHERPVLIVPQRLQPALTSSEPLWWTFRDREEELVAVARRIIRHLDQAMTIPLSRAAVVFKRPLPYLYLAAEVFKAADLHYQTSEAKPFASEPSVAAFDLILDAVSANFTRETLLALLRSPHFVFFHEGSVVTTESVRSLDRELSEARYLGDLERLEELARQWAAEGSTAIPALSACLALAREIEPLRSPDRASVQVARLRAFWSAHLKPLADGDPFFERETLARAALADTLDSLTSAHASYDDPSWTIEETTLAIRRWIEERTFEVDAVGSGLKLLDDQAARYTDLDDLTVVGVVDPDWPERPHREIFFAPSLLRALGWPSERDRWAAGEARFLDLLASASRRTLVSTFTLEDDALVSKSMLLDEIHRAGLQTESLIINDDKPVFLDEKLATWPILGRAASGSDEAIRAV
ncbi:MAG TPA: hypothetical protein VNZ26_36280, partial [Vicinamibacterales bacterium]|nr:hypothetical protein [Vicinamibacterales bacterium]